MSYTGCYFDKDFLNCFLYSFQKPVRGYNITSPWVYRNALPLTQNKDLFEVRYVPGDLEVIENTRTDVIV